MISTTPTRSNRTGARPTLADASARSAGPRPPRDLPMAGDPRPLARPVVHVDAGLGNVLPDRVDVRELDGVIAAGREFRPHILDRPCLVLRPFGREHPEAEEVADDDPVGRRPAGETLATLAATDLEIRVEPERQVAVRDEETLAWPGRQAEVVHHAGDRARLVGRDLAHVFPQCGVDDPPAEVGAIDEEHQ